MMILKKKTIIIVTLVLLIVAAGYISTKYGKLISVNSEEAASMQSENVDKLDAQTANNQATTAYFIDVKLGRENQRTIDKQTLTEMINNKNTSKEAKKSAEEKLLSLVDVSEKEMIMEALIKAKGFEDAVVFLTSDSANVTVKSNDIKAEQVNQIKNIVCEESDLPAAKVMIQTRE